MLLTGILFKMVIIFIGVGVRSFNAVQDIENDVLKKDLYKILNSIKFSGNPITNHPEYLPPAFVSPQHWSPGSENTIDTFFAVETGLHP